MNTVIYPNSIDGIKQFLLNKKEVQPSFVRDEFGAALEFAKIFPDPQVSGVWAVDSTRPRNRVRVIVYLGGYKDAWGNNRNYNDFEVCERP